MYNALETYHYNAKYFKYALALFFPNKGWKERLSKTTVPKARHTKDIVDAKGYAYVYVVLDIQANQKHEEAH